MTRVRRLEKWPTIWAAICALLIGVIAALMVSNIANRNALEASRAATALAKQTARQVKCLNRSLRTRQQFFNADHRAEVAKVSGQVRGLLELHRDAEAGILQFTRASEDYLHRIAVLDKASHAHPLGRC